MISLDHLILFKKDIYFSFYIKEGKTAGTEVKMYSFVAWISTFYGLCVLFVLGIIA